MLHWWHPRLCSLLPHVTRLRAICALIAISVYFFLGAAAIRANVAVMNDPFDPDVAGLEQELLANCVAVREKLARALQYLRWHRVATPARRLELLEQCRQITLRAAELQAEVLRAAANQVDLDDE